MKKSERNESRDRRRKARDRARRIDDRHRRGSLLSFRPRLAFRCAVIWEYVTDSSPSRLECEHNADKNRVIFHVRFADNDCVPQKRFWRMTDFDRIDTPSDAPIYHELTQLWRYIQDWMHANHF